jgi:hypothetical protein
MPVNAVVSIAGLTLAEWIFGWELGIDQLLFTAPPEPARVWCRLDA